MTVPPHGPGRHGGHRPPPHWATPPHRPPHPGAPAGPPPQQWGPPGGPPPPQWGTPTGPPPQWGPPQQQWGTPATPDPTPAPKGRGPLIAVLAVLAVVVVVVGGGLLYLFSGDDKSDSTEAAAPSTSTKSSTSTTSPSSSTPPSNRGGSPSTKGGSTPGAPAPAGGPAGALLPASDLTERMKVPMSASSTESGSAPLSNVTVSPTNCTAAYLPASAEAYGGSGYTELTVAGYRGPGNSIGTSVIEAVAKFPDATAAKNFVDSQLGKWQGCKSTNVSATYGDGATLPGKVTSAYQSRSDTVSVDIFTNLKAGSDGCEHSITYSGDVVIDARVCSDGSNGHNAGGESTSIVHAIQRNLR